jgi:septal ring factor EnvC (AmiA/AmiB activator)
MYTRDDLQNLSEEDKKKQKHSIGMQITILESDLKKCISQKNILDAEIKNLKMNQRRIEVELGEKSERLKKLDRDISQGEEELLRTRKRLNYL